MLVEQDLALHVEVLLEELSELEALGSTPMYACGTPVDVSPSLDAWHCFPMSGLPGVRLEDYEDAAAVTGACGAPRPS